MTTLRPIFAIAGIGIILVASFPLAAMALMNTIGIPTIAWGPCHEDWVGQPPDRLGGRLQCASISVPLDHGAPDGRMIEVGVVRVRAALPAQREGAIFFNVGGPGTHPGKPLRTITSAWTAMGLHLPDEMDKRRLAERYDFVAVIPRGLLGSSAVQCGLGPAPRFAFPSTHPDDANWQLMLDEAQSVADACGALPYARYINTEQHVHDMDMVRRAMGDQRLHFYGISHGGMVGAWYASTYPDHAGRMLLDSTIDFTHHFRTSLRVAMHARQKAYVESVVEPLLGDPARFGLAGDREAVEAAIDRIPARIREISVDRINSPLQLAAVLHLAAWWNGTPPPTLERMKRTIDGSLRTIDASLARRIRFEAHRFASALYARHAPRPYFIESPEEWSVRNFMPCNDEAWNWSERDIRHTAQRDAVRYYHATGIETLEELICSRWGVPSARAPDLATLDHAEPFLLLQSEKDVTTPLEATSHILDRFSNARMLLVRDSNQHGLFNFVRSSCIERTAAHYLLTGELPFTGSRVFSCQGTGGLPPDAIPGEPRPPPEQPVPTAAPSPVHHDEL